MPEYEAINIWVCIHLHLATDPLPTIIKVCLQCVLLFLKPITFPRRLCDWFRLFYTRMRVERVRLEQGNSFNTSNNLKTKQNNFSLHMCTSIIFDFEKFIAGEVCT